MYDHIIYVCCGVVLIIAIGALMLKSFDKYAENLFD